MKKWISILLVISMALVLMACDKESDEDPFNRVYTYYEDGKIRTESVFDENGKLLGWMEYSYYDDGTIKTMGVGSEADKIDSLSEYCYNENGTYSSIKYQDMKKGTTTLTEISYFESGTIQSFTEQDITNDTPVMRKYGECFENQCIKILIRYYDNGSVESRIEYAEDPNAENLKRDDTGVLQTGYYYQSSPGYYALYTNLAPWEYAKSVEYYDQDGNITEKYENGTQTIGN